MLNLFTVENAEKFNDLFLNIETGEFILVTSEELRAAEEEEPFDHLPDWQQEDRKVAIDVIENFENYKELPT
ncbi:hypothetical protein ACSU6B_19675 [Neobacillus sp. C211]|uniref:hypothetical protein n=1 Tax=unclassified Neobacillus TaxID=2675272 RepID=UPI00397E4CAC